MAKFLLRERSAKKTIAESKRQHLLDVLEKLERSLKKCEEGRCLDASSSDDLKECLYDSTKICLKRTNGAPMFCEWLKREIASVKEELASL